MARRKIYQDTGNDEYRWYSQAYDQGRMRSNILKGKSTLQSNLNDQAGLLSELYQLQGNPDNKEGKWFFKETNSYKMAAIPAIRQEIAEVDRLFQRHRQQRINDGFPGVPDKPENYPPELKKKLQTLQAREDVHLEECAFLEKQLQQFAAKKLNDHKAGVLKFGCRQWSRGGASGAVKWIDGQTCSIICGIPVIDDPQSKYNGMSVMDYRSIICPLFKANEKKKSEAQLLKLQAQATAENQPIPKEFVYGIYPISQDELPEWPAGVKNYKAIQPEAEEVVEDNPISKPKRSVKIF